MDIATGLRRNGIRTRRQGETAERAGPEPSGAALGPAAILLAGLWFGAVVGVLELAIYLATKPLRDPGPGFFRMNRHVVWMIPWNNLLLFGGCGVLAALLTWARPRLGARVAAYLYSYLGFLSLLLCYRPLFAWACVFLAGGLGFRLGRRILRHEARFGRLVRRTAPAVGFVVVFLAGSSFYRNVVAARAVAPGLPPVPGTAPNVLLIVLDTVRADRLSVYGYGRDTTPHLKGLARDGVRFEHARSVAPWTLPSHASILTGRWPHELGADLEGPLDATFPTLAEFLAARGYDTAGFVSNMHYTSAETGLDRGFAHYEDHDLSAGGILRTSAFGGRVVWEVLDAAAKGLGRPLDRGVRKDAERVSGQLLDWLARRPEGRPFFAFMNYYDAHNDYIPPTRFPRRFGERPRNARDEEVLVDWFYLDKRKLTPREVQLALDGYDDCLAYLDEQLGRMFDELARRGTLQNTVVIVTADHGEHFGEHGLYGHASSLYNQELHVPLLIVAPHGVPAGRSVGRSVTLRDIPATVADLLGFGADSPFPGRSLARHWDPGRAEEDFLPDFLLSEVDAPVKTAPNQGRSPVFRGAMKALVADETVYIRNGDGVEELYEYTTDPDQVHDLSGSEESRPLLEKFRIELRGLLDAAPPRVRPG